MNCGNLKNILRIDVTLFYALYPHYFPLVVVTFVEFQVEYRAYLGQIPACNGYINEFNLSCKSATNNSSEMSRICA